MLIDIRKIISIFILTSLFSCVQFKTATLYDGVETPDKSPKPKSISSVVEPVIYDDNTKDMWGIEKDVCKDVSISTDIAYDSEESILLTWNRDNEGCIWAGIGIGWDGYAGKDLTEIMNYAAIEFYVRTKEGRSFGLPFVLTFEDYSGGMGFCYTANKYFERVAIDEEWQRVAVPLRDFDLETENLDVTNIKQLQIELQGSGSVYIDDMKLVFHEPEPVEAWLEEEILPDPTAMPISIFEDEFINNNSFGITKIKCQDVRIEPNSGLSSSQGIHASWDVKSECRESSFGASWNKWHPVDLTKVKTSAAFQFDLKIQNISDESGFSLGFEDYERMRGEVVITEKFSSQSSFQKDAWMTLTVPLSEIEGNLDFKRIKMMYFGFKGKGDIYLDNIRLVNYPQ